VFLHQKAKITFAKVLTRHLVQWRLIFEFYASPVENSNHTHSARRSRQGLKPGERALK